MSQTIFRAVNLQMAESREQVVRYDAQTKAPLVEVVGDPFLTIQGEGPFAGQAAVYVRLAGCNLMCGPCDTQYTQGRKFKPVGDVITWIMDRLSRCRFIGGQVPLVVITGGEPFRQRTALHLIRDLLLTDDRLHVQVETNGTIYPDYEDCPLPTYSGRLTVVVSPKTPTMPAGLHEAASCFKYVMEADAVDPSDGLPSVTISGLRPARPSPGKPVYLQPADAYGDATGYAKNVAAAVQSCLKFGYRLSLQTHKLIGVP